MYRMPRGIAFLVLMLTASAACGGPINVWDIANGNQVTGHSPVAQYSDYPSLYGQPFSIDIRDMFGGAFSTGPFPGEIGNVRFGDGQGAGALHWVEWSTQDLVRLESFRLHARGDGPEVGYRRSYSRFRLLALDEETGLYSVLYDFSPSGYPQPEFLAADLAPTIARQFRAEFTQQSNDLFGGPRIFELEGFGSVVPEPASLLMAGFGTLGLGAFIVLRSGQIRRGA